MRNSRIIAFLLALVLCVSAVTAVFAEKSVELTEELADKLYSIARKTLKEEGYKIDDYVCSGETVGNERWFTFQKGSHEFRCDVNQSTKYVEHLTNFDFYKKDGKIRDAKTAKKSEITKARNKINKFLKKHNPKLSKRGKKLVLDQVLVKGKNRYLEFSENKWNGMTFTIRVYPSVRIEVFHAPD